MKKGILTIISLPKTHIDKQAIVEETPSGMYWIHNKKEGGTISDMWTSHHLEKLISNGEVTVKWDSKAKKK